MRAFLMMEEREGWKQSVASGRALLASRTGGGATRVCVASGGTVCRVHKWTRRASVADVARGGGGMQHLCVALVSQRAFALLAILPIRVIVAGTCCKVL